MRLWCHWQLYKPDGTEEFLYLKRGDARVARQVDGGEEEATHDEDVHREDEGQHPAADTHTAHVEHVGVLQRHQATGTRQTNELLLIGKENREIQNGDVRLSFQQFDILMEN